MNILKEVLSKEGYGSSEEIVRDWALIMALSKLEKYRAENEFYRNKYHMELEEFETILHKDKGQESFEKEEDVEDWEFSLNAMKWWEEKVKELQNAIQGT